MTTAYRPYGFGRALLEARTLRREFPLLERASANAKPAVATKIEWINPDGTTDFNYTQIVRSPLGYSTTTDDRDEERAKRLLEHLQAIEDTLWHGHRESDAETHRGFCGGVHELLGREPVADDVIRLRILRDLTWIYRTDDAPPAEFQTSEWLTEFSLEARPGVPVAVG